MSESGKSLDACGQEVLEKFAVENRKLIWRIEKLERALKRYRAKFGDIDAQKEHNYNVESVFKFDVETLKDSLPKTTKRKSRTK